MVQGKLFTAESVGISALGSLIGSGILLAHKYRCLGERRAAILSLLACIALTVALAVVGMLLPAMNSTAAVALIMARSLGIMAYASFTQSEYINAYRKAGGPMASTWMTVAVGVFGLLVFIAMEFAIKCALRVANLQSML